MIGPDPAPPVVSPPSTTAARLAHAIQELAKNRKSKATARGPPVYSLAPTASICTWNANSVTPYPDKASVKRHLAVAANLVKLSAGHDFVCIQETNCNENEGINNPGVIGRMVPGSTTYYSNFLRHNAGVAIIVPNKFLKSNIITHIVLPPSLKGYALALLITPVDPKHHPIPSTTFILTRLAPHSGRPSSRS